MKRLLLIVSVLFLVGACTPKHPGPPPPPPADSCGDGQCIAPESNVTCPVDCPAPLPTDKLTAAYNTMVLVTTAFNGAGTILREPGVVKPADYDAVETRDTAFHSLINAAWDALSGFQSGEKTVNDVNKAMTSIQNGLVEYQKASSDARFQQHLTTIRTALAVYLRGGN